VTDRIESLPNLGPFMARRLIAIDVRSADDLRSMGPIEAYARLRFQFGSEITLNALWAMDGALSGVDWRHLSRERKQELKEMLARRGPGS